MIAELSDYFSSKGVSNLYITASSKKSQKQISEGEPRYYNGNIRSLKGLGL